MSFSRAMSVTSWNCELRSPNEPGDTRAPSRVPRKPRRPAPNHPRVGEFETPEGGEKFAGQLLRLRQATCPSGVTSTAPPAATGARRRAFRDQPILPTPKPSPRTVDG